MTRNRHSKQETENPLAGIVSSLSKAPSSRWSANYSGGSVNEQSAPLRLRTQQISIGIPMDELMFSQFLDNFIHLNIMPWDELITTRSTYLPEARNKIHNLFLEKGTGTHLLMLDSDVLPPPNFINRMLDHNLPIVGGWYRKKEKYPIKDGNGNVIKIQRPVVYDFKESDAEADWFIERLGPGTGLEKVDGAGAGCWLMRRDVAEALGKSPYSMERGGEDLVLCRKIAQAGFPIYVDWDAACAHCGVFWV